MTTPDMELRRARTEAPTEPGWYYAVLNGGVTIIPVNVSKYRDVGDLVVYDYHFREWFCLTQFAWFGPVPTCVESGT